MNTSPATPLMVAPLRTVGALTASGENVTTSLPLTLAPFGMVRPLATAEPSTGPAKRGRGRPKGSKNGSSVKKPKVEDPDSRKVSSCENFDSKISQADRETGNKEIVDSVLMRFDAVRRRLCQIGIKKDLLTTALSNCMNMGVRTNMKKRMGPVPGVDVGDIYFFWGEMCLVGLHYSTMSGIAYMTDKDEGCTQGPLATSVVTSGHYDDKRDDLETLIYTGQGEKDKHQELERGNLALLNSNDRGNDVRVIIGQADPNNKNKTIYIYDGVYTVSEYWITLGKTGFKEYKYKLVRKPGQPSAYAKWKSIEQWRNGDSRKGFLHDDISGGRETLPVPVVNEVDETDKTMPDYFGYATSQSYTSCEPVSTDGQTLGCQNCQGHSCPKDSSCECLIRNDCKLPYQDDAILVCRKPMIYECGDHCFCSRDCRFRVVHAGLKIHMEVFKTETRGWGLRSSDPIRAGKFICEFVGRRKTKQQVDEDGDNEYLFDSSRIYNHFRWNYEPELVKEDCWEQVPELYNLPYQVFVCAKDYGNIGRFMNHSCSPNVFWQLIEYEVSADSYVRIGLFAKKHIPPLTELTYDYGMSHVTEEVGEDREKVVIKGKRGCLCGSINCRGSFG